MPPTSNAALHSSERLAVKLAYCLVGLLLFRFVVVVVVSGGGVNIPN